MGVCCDEQEKALRVHTTAQIPDTPELEPLAQSIVGPKAQ